MIRGQGDRRLSAILAADVAGYTRLIEQDADGTVAAWTAARDDVIQPAISERAGRIVKLTGDGFLAEFWTVQDAVTCAMVVQSQLRASPLKFRMGIHLGDVIDDGQDIHGEGVNIAARIEALSEPGGVCVSAMVFESVRNRVKAEFADIGEHQVKNVSAPVRVYRIESERAAQDSPELASPELALPSKPSIAVLPFDNMSGDPEQEFFADGIAEDLITALSRFRSLFVIARSSSFTYKGKAVNVTQISRELGVRYIVEGSVRRAGDTVRVTAQLVDATTGNHLWADRFDGRLSDVFDLQDRITEQIVVSVEPEILTIERDIVKRKPPESLDAWELVQRGLSHLYGLESREEHEEAVRLFKQAIELDPEFAEAHARLAFAGYMEIMFGFAEHPNASLASARRSAIRAVSLDENEPTGHVALGRVHTLEGNVEMAIRDYRTAIAINPNLALGHHGLGHTLYYGAARLEEALKYCHTALRLSPRDPWRASLLMIKGAALRNLGQYTEAIEVLQQASQLRPQAMLIQMHLAAALVEVGEIDEAKAAVERARDIQPRFSLDFVRDHLLGIHPENLERLLESLRKAGVSENLSSGQ